MSTLFFSDGEINDYINTGLGELHDILVLKFEDYYASSVAFSLTSGTSSYTLSSINLNNLYKLLGVDIKQGSQTVRVPRYSLTGNTLNFIPDPSSSDEVTVWYVPSYVKLINDSDQVDDRIASNWEDYAVYTAAIRMRQKEETSTTSIEREKEKIEARIEDAAANRDAGEPMGITDEDTGISVRHWLFR